MNSRASHSFSIYGAADSSCDVFGKGGMGFRDLSCFKIALLARQGWRIMTHPDAFLVRILQGRNFPNSDFMQARRGSSPSWGWSSILSARSVLEKGVYRSVSTGEKRDVWNEKWVSTLPGSKLMSSKPQGCTLHKVADLLTPYQTWNVGL